MFRFTIRDVPWLTVVVATGAGWWVQARVLESHREADFKKWMAHHRMIVLEFDNEHAKLEEERDALLTGLAQWRANLPVEGPMIKSQ